MTVIEKLQINSLRVICSNIWSFACYQSSDKLLTSTSTPLYGNCYLATFGDIIDLNEGINYLSEVHHLVTWGPIGLVTVDFKLQKPSNA